MKSIRYNKYWCIPFVILLVFSASAQEESSKFQKASINFGFQFGSPTSAFKKNLGDFKGYGVDFAGVWHPLTKLPEIGIGASLSYMHFGRDVNAIRKNNVNELRIKTTHSVIPLHGILRYQPVNNKRVNPYFDLLIGRTIFATKTKENKNFLETILDGKSEDIVIEEFTHDAFSWGAALGIMIELGEKRETAFGLKVVSMKGNATQYSRKGDTKTINESIEYTFHHSKTDMYLLQADVIIYLF